MELKRTHITKIIPSKKNKAGGITLSDFKLLQGCSNQNSMLLVSKETNRKWKRTEASEAMPHIYNHLIFDKSGKNKQ